MSFPISLSSLSRDDKIKIRKELEIHPVAPPNSSFGGGGGQKAFGGGTAATPFTFFVASSSDDELRIPLQYAKTFFPDCDIPGDDPKWGLLPPFTPLIELRDEQIPVVNEAYDQILKTGCTTIQVYPGMGKTIMSGLMSLRLGLKFAIIVPVTAIVPQWVKTIESIGGDALRIFLPDQPSKAAKKKGVSVESLNFDVIITLPERFAALPKECTAQIGTLIIDEAHICCVPSYVVPLLTATPKHIIALTATLQRDDCAHRMIQLLAGEHDVFRKQMRPFVVVPVQSGVVIPEKLNKAGTLDYISLCVDIGASEPFNAAVLKVVVSNPDKKFIILTHIVKHATEMAKLLKSAGVASDVMCGSKKTCVDTRVMIGTTKKIGTGWDAATACQGFDGRSPDALILTHTIKKWQNFTQAAGRIMRADSRVTPVIFWMQTRNSITSRHLSQLKKYILSINGTILKDGNFTTISSPPSSISVAGGITTPIDDIINIRAFCTDETFKELHRELVKDKEM